VVLNVHHIESRLTGGNRPDNLITLCETCHENYHQGKIVLRVKKTKGFKAETAMSVIRWRLVDALKAKYPIVYYTYGYVTKSNRVNAGLSKSHANDAFCIGGIKNNKRAFCYIIVQKRKNNRGIQYNRKGYAPTIRKCRYKIQKYDIVVVNSVSYFAMGILGKGRYFYVLNHSKKYLPCKLISKHFMAKTFVYFNLF
jgi:N6-L-threonylcarbamoyladenine synthase